MHVNRKKLIQMIIAVIANIAWFCVLRKAEGTYVGYMAIGILSICLTGYVLQKDYHVTKEKKNIWMMQIMAVLYASSVTFANYRLLMIQEQLTKIIWFIVLFVVSYTQMLTILNFVQNKWKNFHWKETNENNKPLRAFAIAFVLVVTVDILYLLGYVYPGAVDADALWQIQQAIDHSYFNHHPFWHTMIIRFCIKAGGKIFGTINGGIAIYVCMQAMLMAFAVAYSYMTLYQINVNKWLRYFLLFWYVGMPFNIAHSGSVWKDCFFASFVLVHATTLIRIMYGIGKSVRWNYIFFAIATLGFMVFRSNGWIALGITIVAFAVLFRKQVKTPIIIMAVVVVAIKLINIPVFAHYNVTPTDVVESISIPVQQIGRVAADGGDINEEERELLETVVNVDELPNIYTIYISDPIKEVIYGSGNSQYIIEEKFKFLKVWMGIGIRNPVSYLHAWIDQTKGYWDCGEPMSIWSTYIIENEYDIHRDVPLSGLTSLWQGYLDSFENTDLLQLFVNIGLYVWILFVLAYVGIKDNFVRIMPFIPIISIWLTLLIATPVNGVFRYMYAFIYTMPIVSVSVFCQVKDENNQCVPAEQSA